MAIDRTGSNQPTTGSQRPAQPVARVEAGPGMERDRATFGPRPQAATPAFSWGRAMGHFWNGFKREFLDGVDGLIHHPLKTLAWLAGSVALVAALPLILPVSAAAVGTAMAVGFVGMGLYKAGTGAYQAVQDYRKGDTAGAEQDFEQIGRGSFDVAAVVVPAAATRAVTVLAQTEAGEAVFAMVQEGPIGRASGAAMHAVEGLPGRVLGEERAAALGGRLAAVPSNPTLAAIRGSAPAQRVGGAFNWVFDNPAVRHLIEADNAWMARQLDRTPMAQALRDWAKAHTARAAGVAAVATAPANQVSKETGIGGDANVPYQDLRKSADFERVAPGYREQVIRDLEGRGIKGYTPEDIVIGRKRLFQADVIPQERYAELGIRKVVVEGQERWAVPTIDSSKPLTYPLDTPILQKLLTDPDTGALILKDGRPQPMEIFGVTGNFKKLYGAAADGHVIALDKRVVAIRATQPGQLKTPWDPMDVRPGDAIMYPINEDGGRFALGAPYRHGGGQLLKDAYNLSRN